MRHLFALLALALGLAACDDSSTTAPVTDAIPGPPNAPRLTVTVLTGTKDAPADTPTVRVAWAYTDSVLIITLQNLDSTHQFFKMKPVGDTIFPMRKIGASILTIPGGDTIPESPLLGVYAWAGNLQQYTTTDTSNHIYFKK